MARKSKLELEEYLIRMRRKEVTEMWFAGATVKEMAEKFKVDERTIYRDCEYIETHAYDLMRNYITRTVPFILARSLYQINYANQIASKVAQQEDLDPKTRVYAALAVAKTAKDIIELVADNKSIVDMAVELDQTLNPHNVDNDMVGTDRLDAILLRRRNKRLKSTGEDPEAQF